MICGFYGRDVFFCYYYADRNWPFRWAHATPPIVQAPSIGLGLAGWRLRELYQIMKIRKINNNHNRLLMIETAYGGLRNDPPLKMIINNFIAIESFEWSANQNEVGSVRL